MSTDDTVTPVRRRRWMRWSRWLWWWSATGGFAAPGPRIASPAYRARILADCDNALASGAVDLATGAMFEQLVDADLYTDLRELDEEHSRRSTVIGQRRAAHERRRARADVRRRTLEAALGAEVDTLRALDAEIHARRRTTAHRANGHRISRPDRIPTDDHR